MINDIDRDYRLLPVEWLHNIWRPDSFFKNAKQVIIMTVIMVTLMILNKDKSFPGHFPTDDNSKSLHLALQQQENHVHGQVSQNFFKILNY